MPVSGSELLAGRLLSELRLVWPNAKLNAPSAPGHYSGCGGAVSVLWGDAVPMEGHVAALNDLRPYASWTLIHGTGRCDDSQLAVIRPFTVSRDGRVAPGCVSRDVWDVAAWLRERPMSHVSIRRSARQYTVWRWPYWLYHHVPLGRHCLIRGRVRLPSDIP